MFGQVAEGTRLIIKNSVTGEWTRATILEAFERGRATIIFGTLHAHQIWLPATHGRIDVPERPTCIVIMPSEPSELIETFNAEHFGYAHYLVEYPSAELGIPIISIDNNRIVPKVYGPTFDKNAMLKRGVNTVTMYDEWKRRRVAVVPA